MARHTITWSSAIVTSAVPLENSSPLEPELQSFTRSTGVSLRLHDIDYIEFVASGVVNFVVWSTTVGSFSFNENNYPVEFFVVSKSDTFTAQPPTSAFLTGTAAEGMKVKPAGNGPLLFYFTTYGHLLIADTSFFTCRYIIT